MRAPRKIYELEEAEREISATIDEGTPGLAEFELGLLAGKLAALRWALGGSQGPLVPPREVRPSRGAIDDGPAVILDFESADGGSARG